MADAAQLDRMLLNLIANAGHAMPRGGTVTLGTEHRVVTVAESRVPDTIAPGDYVVITVADTGIGIPPDQMSRVFDAGFTTRRDAGGSGLGLSSTRDIVRQSNGYLAVESVEGRGTRFEIYLPRVAGAPPPILPEAAPKTTARTVLLVEDDLLVRRVAERALLRAGWTVLCAGSAENALEVLKESTCNLMISDIVLPGMDGMALARLLLAGQPGLPVILTSGYENTAADHGLAVANVAFLTKPYGQQELLAEVARVAETVTARE
jgi:two-component system cell cycle sensor histidine kinase/response regulator CckA